MGKWLLLSVITGTATLIVYLYIHLGAYKPVEFSHSEVGPLHLLFKTHVGPYHGIMPKILEAEAFAKKNGLDCARTFGEYLDDPKGVDEDRLRSHAGCVLESTPTTESLGDFTFELRPRRHYVVARFSGSPSIGPMKVYPKLDEYLQRERLASSPDPILEIYTVNGDQVETEYLFPLSDK